MVKSLSCQLWEYDDVTSCTRDDILNYKILAVPLAISCLTLTFKSVESLIKRNRKIQLNDENRPLLASTNGNNKYSDNDNEHNELYNGELMKAKHFDLIKLENLDEQGNPHGKTIMVGKNSYERLRIAIEYLLVTIQLIVSLSMFFVPGFDKEFDLKHKLIKLLFWGYLFFIATIRIINTNKVHVKLPSLFAHSTLLYAFNVVPAILIFRSVLIGHVKHKLIRNYYILNFIVSFILFVSNMMAEVGDKPATIYVTSDGSYPSPENTSSIFSFITYSWIDKFIWQGYKNTITEKDVWSLAESDYALNVLKGFEAAQTTTKFTVKVFTHFKGLFALQAFYAIIESFLVFTPTLLLKQVLEYVADPTSLPKNVAWSLVILMSLCKIVDSFASGCSLYLGRRVCTRMKAVIIGEVYAKALRRKITVSNYDESKKEDENQDELINSEEVDASKTDGKKDDKEQSSTAELGAIINLMAVDAFKVSEVCGYLHYFSGAIIMIFVCLMLLYNLIGWSACTGVLIILAILPINYKLTIWIGDLQKSMLAITDKRIQKLNETLQSIRIIKFFAWEKNFFNDVMKLRNEEIAKLTSRCIFWALGGTVWLITPTLITLSSFYCYVIIDGNTLTAPIAFTALSLFTLLRAPLDQLADMTALVIQSKVSLDRVGDFLAEPETSKYEQLTSIPDENSPKIGFQNANFTWNKFEPNAFKLRDINVGFKEGKLNVIYGATGSGKTSLLLALLGEMELEGGKVFLPGILPRDDLTIDKETGLTDSVAYCSQSAWLLNDTIRGNILFGSPFNQDRYDKVVEACGLSRDLEILAAGDQTEVGEKGITLSGGQKQRVSLARALYSNSKTIILDDCLSAVDSHTGLWVYENCITGPLMNNRTCILVSHNIPLTISNAEWVVIMDNGRIKTQNTAERLLESGELGADDLIKSSVLNSRSQSTTDLSNVKDNSKEAKNADLKAKSAIIEAKLKTFNDGNPTEPDAKDSNIRSDGKLVEEEEKADGAVSATVYTGYLSFFGGYGTWIGLLVIYFVGQGVYILQSWWLRKWALKSEQSDIVQSFVASYSGLQNNYIVQSMIHVHNSVNKFKEDHGPLYYIIIYGIIGVIYTIVNASKIILTFLAGIRASNKIFVTVLEAVLNAKLRFFDKTPVGRIMNRFSKDIEAVDQELTPFAEFTFACLVQCASTLFLITLITPGFLVFAFLIAFIYYVIGILYISLTRELKRFESVSKSPIHQHFSESLSGIATIRAYGVESRFMRQNINKIDTNNKPFFYLWVANRWLALRIDTAGALVTLFAGMFVLFSVDVLDAGLAGLSLTYAIAFSESALWIVRLYSNLEMNMNSVERLQEYFDIDQEPPHEIPETEPRASWPENGEIDVQDVSLRYAPDLPRVIKNITFHVEAKNKIGIVGRTGAGKSTIITAFFRFLDPETGKILIDGVDICKIGLRNLRQALTIIPQDPTLFTGTIKSNLDPFSEFTDKEIFEALRRVNLVTTAELNSSPAAQSLTENKNQFLDLNSPVTEGGSNLSQGQRQLMCLARSLLRNPKVILLDEATASIDYESDALIQQTIREEFSNSTILTIAHRLRSIIDYDKILVMDAGKVVEYDDPYTLIANKDSLFHSMCDNSGELDTLIKLAKEAFVAKKNKKT